jgi:cytochrome c-type biogenesis protein CcmH/NrfF
MIWVVWALPFLAVLVLYLILYLEDRYYRKHPEKERPDVSPWP